MDNPRRVRRRILLASLGAISGLFSGVGAQIVLSQSGHISLSLAIGLPLAGIIIGAVVGALDLPRTADRIVTLAIALTTLTVVGFAFAAPASAQDGCVVEVTVGATKTDLSTTSANTPLIIDLSSAPEISFATTTPNIRQGTVEVSVASITPLDFLVEPGGTVIYYADINAEPASSKLQIKKSGPTGFVVTGPSFTSPVLPMGLVELDIIVKDTSSNLLDGCNGSAWIRFVARPVSNLIGLIGLGLSGLGLLGFGGLHVAKDVARRRQLMESGLERRLPPLVKPPTQGPWIPSHGESHAPYVESRLLDSQSKRVDVDHALVEGREYRLELTLNPGVREEDQDETTRRDVTISGWSAGVEVEPVFQLGFSGTPLSIEIPITPRREGRHDVVFDLTSNGHLLQTERIAVSVVSNERRQPAGPGQTTRTVFSASDFSAYDLAQRKPRGLLVILESDEDGTVDARVRDQDGKPVVTFDSPLKPAALVEAADDTRKQLQRLLQRGSGIEQQVSREQLEAMLIPLVKAGRQMHRALFPPGSIRQEDIETLESHVVNGVTIQVIQERAGLGYSTLPWNLVYDHPFLPHTKRNRLCPEFPNHSADACPNRNDPEVMCPTGFWGFRAIVEEPWVSAGTAILTPPVGRRGSVAIGYFDAELSDSERQATALAQLGMERVEDFDRLLDVLRDQPERIGLMYFYAHHAFDRDIGTHGIAIGNELLTSLTFDALDVEWTSRPLVIINGCGSGDYSPTDPLSLLEEFRRAGAVGTVTTECAVWDPLAGALGEQIVDALAKGGEIGTILQDLRRFLLIRDNNLLGFVYRLQALSETTAAFRAASDDTLEIEIDLRAADQAVQRSEDTAL